MNEVFVPTIQCGIKIGSEVEPAIAEKVFQRR